MSRVQFGTLSTFDHNVQNWKTYKSRISQYFVANDLCERSDSNGRKRKAILLSALSEERTHSTHTYRLATDLALPKNVEDVPYEDFLKLLGDHFTPKRVGFGERHNFYSATQQTCESHAVGCETTRANGTVRILSNVEEALRDKFIMGFEKEKLYAQDLTLAKVVEMAENLCCARAAAASASAAAPLLPAAAPDAQLYKITNNGRREIIGKVKCSVCGFTNHKSYECKYKNYTCKKCHEKGHLRKMCRKVNYVEVDVGDDDGKIYYIRSYNGKPMVESE